METPKFLPTDSSVTEKVENSEKVKQILADVKLKLEAIQEAKKNK